MKNVYVFTILLLIRCQLYSQENVLYQTGLTADQNLEAIGKLAPYSTGGVGFDSRYEGIKGSPQLFENLLPSLLRVQGQEYYLQLESNLDITRNLLIFKYPRTGKLLSIPSDMVKEVKIKSNGNEMIFRVTREKNFEREIKDGRFYQVLMDGDILFIKLPIKKIVEADFKAVYSPDRRYDEYTTYYKYYIMRSDSTFHQILLNKKSLIKIFPEKKELISNSFEEKSSENDEDVVLNVLNKIITR